MTNRASTLSAALALAALASACGPDFTSPTTVAGLRVLAVRAEPPELAPPGDASAPARAELGALIAHPAFATDGARSATVLHVACTPALDQADASPCTLLSELASPQTLLGVADLAQACDAPGVGVPGAVTLAGLEACGRDGCGPVTVRRDPADAGSALALPAPAYEVPAALDLGALPAGHPARVLGVEVVDLALAIDAGPDELAPETAVASGCDALAAVAERFASAWDAHAHVSSVKRLRVRGPEARSAPNHNPAVSGIVLEGAPLPAPSAVPAAVPAGAKRALTPLLPGDEAALRETYVEVDAAGAPIREKQEEWTYSWFTTAGELADLHTRSAAEPEELTAPGAGPAIVWLVVRDLRGGVAWTAGAVAAGP